MTAEEQRALMEQALREACDYGDQLADACSRISDQLRQGHNEDGSALLQQLLEGIRCMSEALYLTQPVLQEREIAIDLSELPATLEPLVEAIENRDFGLVGDILTYEIQPVLCNWTNQLRENAVA